MNTPTFIDLFAGVGGIRISMERAGFKCIFSSDIDPDCQNTYRANFPDDNMQGDIKEIDENSIPDHDVLCAGFPCQAFSSAGRKQGFEDARGTLFFEVCRILKAKRPKVVLLENVKNLQFHDKGNTLKVILRLLDELGYITTWQILNGVDFGLPQNRERIIIVGSLGEMFNFIPVQTIERHAMKDFLDEQGEFEYIDSSQFVILDNPKQQPSGLIFSGYMKKSPRPRGIDTSKPHLSRCHRQCNRIYSVDGSMPTLSSQETSGRYYILDNNGRVRKLTLNECWRIMGFPNDFKRPCSKTVQYRQLGNSVCIPMIEAVAREINQQYFTKTK